MELKPIQTLLTLLVFALVGAPAAWLVWLGTVPTGPGDIDVDARGNLHAHYHDKLFSFGAEGQALAGNSELYLWGGVALWAVFAGLLVAGFAIGLRQQRKRAAQQLQYVGGTLAEAFGSAADSPPPTSVHAPGITWLRNSRQMQRVGWMILACLLALVVSGFMLPESKGGECARQSLQSLMLAMSGLFALLGLPAWWVIRHKLRTRLGVFNEWLVLDSPDGAMVACRARDVRHYRGQFLLLQMHKVHLGTPQLGFFHKGDLARYIAPLLQASPAMTSREWGRWRREHDRRTQVLEWLVAAAVLLLFLWWVFGGEEKLDAWLESREQACEQSLQIDAASDVNLEAHYRSGKHKGAELSRAMWRPLRVLTVSVGSR